MMGRMASDILAFQLETNVCHELFDHFSHAVLVVTDAAKIAAVSPASVQVPDGTVAKKPDEGLGTGILDPEYGYHIMIDVPDCAATIEPIVAV